MVSVSSFPKIGNSWKPKMIIHRLETMLFTKFVRQTLQGGIACQESSKEVGSTSWGPRDPILPTKCYEKMQDPSWRHAKEDTAAEEGILPSFKTFWNNFCLIPLLCHPWKWHRWVVQPPLPQTYCWLIWPMYSVCPECPCLSILKAIMFIAFL